MDTIDFVKNIEGWCFRVIVYPGRVLLISKYFGNKGSCVREALKFSRRHGGFHVRMGEPANVDTVGFK